jgi:hypothetical protein
MADVELPAAMALWESVGGLALLKAPCGSTLVLLGDGDGQVVRWNLAQHKTVAARASTRPMEEKRDRGRPRKPATTQQESCQYESVSKEGRKFEGIIVERCATLPPATGYGTLKSLGTCGPGEKYAVAALQQAVLHASLSVLQASLSILHASLSVLQAYLSVLQASLSILHASLSVLQAYLSVLHASLSRQATCSRNCRNFLVAKCHAANVSSLIACLIRANIIYSMTLARFWPSDLALTLCGVLPRLLYGNTKTGLCFTFSTFQPSGLS